MDSHITFSGSDFPVASSMTALQTQLISTKKTTPTPQDWERHKPLIKRLYIEENKKLKDIVAALARHGHHATPKMYKDRFTKWKLDKNNREDNMRAILRKKNERDAVGKNTRFRVNGQIVTMEQVLHYFHRKDGVPSPDQMQLDPPTPSDISCRTPSPALSDICRSPRAHSSPQRQDGLEDRQGDEMTLTSAMNDFEGSDWLLQQNVQRSLEGADLIPLWTTDSVSSISMHVSEIPRSPLAPTSLLVPERLMYTVKTYTVASLESDQWSSGIQQDREQWSFYPSFFTAVKLLDQGSTVEFRRMLSKAFGSVVRAFKSDNPTVLEQLLAVFVMLQNEERMDILELFKKFVLQLVLDGRTKEHPFAQVCRLIKSLQKESFHRAIIQSWEALTDAFRSNLGRTDPFEIDISLTFIYETKTLIEAESLVRRQLLLHEDIQNGNSGTYYHIVEYLGWNALEQGRYTEAEELVLDALAHAEEDMHMQRLMLRLLAFSQYYQGKSWEAENNLRRAIQMSMELRYIDLVIKDLVWLEKWLREWGRTQEANDVKAYRQEVFDWGVGEDEEALSEGNGSNF